MKNKTNSIDCLNVRSLPWRAGAQRTRELGGFAPCAKGATVKLATVMVLLTMTGCGDNFTPAPKVASYDPVTEKLTLPAPCPDWSQSQTQNYLNETHSNYGCAVNNNMALQLENPQDMNEGHGKNTPDTLTTIGVIEQYRAGKIPLALTPTQSSSTAQ